MKLSTPLLVVAIAVAALVSTCIFTVYETDKAMILRLGKIMTDSEDKIKIYEPGLHWKLPILDTVKSFDTRARILDVKSLKVKTAEKKIVEVDFYVQWRIEDLAIFYKRTGGFRSKAEALLQDKAIAGLVIEFGRLTIPEVVSKERAELMTRLSQLTDTSTEGMGISVTDLRVKRINFPQEVSESVYNRMRAERERIANGYRAEGQKEAIEIRAEAEKRKKVILAKAESKAKEIIGEGDATAVQIYAQAYKKYPDFFEFYRSLDAYKQAFNSKNDVLVLKPEGEFFKYFHGKQTK